MKLTKNERPSLSQTPGSVATRVVQGEDVWPSVDRRPGGLTVRVRKIDCMLADIQVHIQTLRQEQTYLGMVREELIGKEARRRMA